MSEIFKPVDFDAVQLMYGFVLIAAAMVLAIMTPGNVFVLTGFVCLLLLKDGIPNLVVGFMKLSSKKDKVVE